MNAIVLSGGGAKGAYEAGLVTTLVKEFGEHFDVVCGTSIGAINASLLAQDTVDALAQTWATIAAAKIIDPVPRVVALQSLFHETLDVIEARGVAKVAAVAEQFVPAIASLRELTPFESLSKLTGALVPTGARKILAGKLSLADVKRILIVSATNLTCQRQETFFTFPGDYAPRQAAFCQAEPEALPFRADLFSETIRASGAVPAAFEPVVLAVEAEPWAYVDGGVTNNTPIGQAIDAGADTITIVYLEPAAQPAHQACANIAEILMGCYAMMQQRILALDYQTALRVNDAVGASAPDTQGKRIVKLRTFRPKTALAVGVLEFDNQQSIDRAFEQGRADASDAALRNAYAS